MDVMEELVGKLLLQPNPEIDGISEEMGCSKYTAANYISRMKTKGKIEDVTIPGLPEKGGWVLVHHKGRMRGNQILNRAFSWRTGSSMHHLSLFQSFRDFSIARKWGRYEILAKYSSFDIPENGLVFKSALPQIGGKLQRKVMKGLSLAKWKDNLEIADSLHASPGTVSKVRKILMDSGYLQRMFLPQENDFLPQGLKGKVIFPDFSGNGGEMTMKAIASKDFAYSPFALGAAALDYPLCENIHEFEMSLNRMGGKALTNIVRLSGGPILATQLSPALPRRMKDGIRESLIRSVSDAFGPDQWNEVEELIVKMKRGHEGVTTGTG